MTDTEQLQVRRTGRFGIVQAAVVTRPDLSPNARLVYVGLTLYAGGTGQAWPSATTLATQLGLGRSTVYRALDELDAAGIITRERRTSPAGADQSTLVTLLDEHGSVPERDTTGVPQRDTGSVPERDTGVPERDTTGVPQRDTNKEQRTTTRARASGPSRPDSTRPCDVCRHIHPPDAEHLRRRPELAAAGAARARQALAESRRQL